MSYHNIAGEGTALLQWNYKFLKLDGGNNVFKVESTSHSMYKGGWAENGIDGLDSRMKELAPLNISPPPTPRNSKPTWPTR